MAISSLFDVSCDRCPWKSPESTDNPYETLEAHYRATHPDEVDYLDLASTYAPVAE